jgi:putative redox protein
LVRGKLLDQPVAPRPEVSIVHKGQPVLGLNPTQDSSETAVQCLLSALVDPGTQHIVEEQTLRERGPALSSKLLKDVVKPELVQEEMCNVAGHESGSWWRQQTPLAQGGISIKQDSEGRPVARSGDSIEVTFLAAVAADGPHVGGRVAEQERSPMRTQQMACHYREIAPSKHLFGHRQVHSWCGHCVKDCTSAEASWLVLHPGFGRSLRCVVFHVPPGIILSRSSLSIEIIDSSRPSSARRKCMASTAQVTWVGPGLRLVGEADERAIVLDHGLPDEEREETGPRPVQLLLIGLCGCTGMDVISILKKKRQSFTGLKVQATADRAEEHPKVYTDIHLEFVVTGEDVDPAAVERSIELSQTKYCPASAMLGQVADITTSFRIEEP